MSTGTSIEWTDASWNPFRGTNGRHTCVRISPGCTHCYAATMNKRFGGPDYVVGADTPRLDEKALLLPLKWKKPRRVFVCSMTDLFLEAHSFEWIKRVWDVMAEAQRHTFQILTKRPARLLEFTQWMAGADHISIAEWPRNCWLGVSCENQQYADERIQLLLQTPAAVRWVSYEPALGPIDIDKYLWAPMALEEIPGHALNDGCTEGVKRRRPGLDWLVIGGESGPGARPFDLAWARSTIAQCKAAGVACFVKQLGRWPLTERLPSDITRNGFPLTDGPAIAGNRLLLHDLKGGDITEWPEDLRVRDYPPT